MEKNVRPKIVADLNQDWTKVCDWFLGTTWTSDQFDRFTELFTCGKEQLRTATDIELDAIQRLARIAFYETWIRSFDRVADDIASRDIGKD